MFEAIYTMFGADEETLFLLVTYSILVVVAVCYIVRCKEKIKERFIFEQRRSRSTFSHTPSGDMLTKTWKEQDESETYAEEVLGLR